VASYGHPRYTKDMDIWVERTRENAQKLLEALKVFGFGDLGITLDDLSTPDRVIQMGYTPSRIDLITSLSGVDFSPCYQGRSTIEMDGVQMTIIDLGHLKVNKRTTGRPQDLADLDALTDD